MCLTSKSSIGYLKAREKISWNSAGETPIRAHRSERADGCVCSADGNRVLSVTAFTNGLLNGQMDDSEFRDMMNKISEAIQAAGIEAQPTPPVVHPGIWCVECNMKPICGARYMKQMENDTFDLCEACYNTLPESQMSEYKLFENDQSKQVRWCC